MNRPAFDLGLFCVCAAGPAVLFAGVLALRVARSGVQADALGLSAAFLLASAALGGLAYPVVSGLGYRVARPPDQAEDYGD